MASTGTAPKSAGKKKGTTQHLTDFLKPEVTSWADDDPEENAPPQPLPTAPGAGLSSYGSGSQGGYSSRSHQPQPELPSNPPFKAYVTNLNHGISTNEVGMFFHKEFPVVEVHLNRFDDSGNVKGAFVEFETQDGLKGALGLTGQPLMGRPVKVDIALPRPPRGGGYDDRGNRGYESRRGGYGDRGGYNEGYRDQQGGYEQRGPPGGYGPPPGAYGGGGYQDGGPRGGGYTNRRVGGDSGFQDRRNAAPGYSEEETTEKWGHKSYQAPEGGQRQSPPPRQHQPAPSAGPTEPPQERKRLVIAPRTSKPAAEGESSTPGSTAGSEAKKSNPFGAAKPINAEARLKEIEEKAAKEKAEIAVAAANAAKEASAAKEAARKAHEAQQAELRQQREAQGHSQTPRAPPTQEAQSQSQPPSGTGQQPLPPPPAGGPNPKFPGPPPGLPPPPSGSGRGQGRGMSLNAANNRVNGPPPSGPPPPGMEGSGHEGEQGGRGRGGRRGRGPPGGRYGGRGEGRGDYSGRGPPPGVEGRGDGGRGRGRGPPPHLRQQQPHPTAILIHKPAPAASERDASDTKDAAGFQEAGSKQSKGKGNRRWETSNQSSASKQDEATAKVTDKPAEKSEQKPANSFAMLTLSDE